MRRLILLFSILLPILVAAYVYWTLSYTGAIGEQCQQPVETPSAARSRLVEIIRREDPRALPTNGPPISSNALVEHLDRIGRWTTSKRFHWSYLQTFWEVSYDYTSGTSTLFANFTRCGYVFSSGSF